MSNRPHKCRCRACHAAGLMKCGHKDARCATCGGSKVRRPDHQLLGPHTREPGRGYKRKRQQLRLKELEGGPSVHFI